MSKIIYVCSRVSTSAETEQKIRMICEALNAGNIISNPAEIFTKEKISYGITNPISALKTHDENVLLGKLFENKEDWYKTGMSAPDGNYALFRANEDQIEILSDCLGTRSIFYYFDDEILVASTSQRAIIDFLGSFVFDERVIPWIISTGSLGPLYCWDKRIKMIPGDGAILLNRNKWSLKVRFNPVEFRPPTLSRKEEEELLKEALIDTIRNIDLDFKKWAITLSGGHDSRSLLLLFKKYSNAPSNSFKTLTWGTKEARLNKKNDAFIAALLAEKAGTNHKYFETDLSDESVEVIVDKFLHHGEGRIDHITGYLDGFTIWKKLNNNGIMGTIRGDEVFGYNKIYSALAVRSFMGLTLCSDFSNLKNYPFIAKLPQETPHHLNRRINESLSTWRDRVFQSYRIPYIQSSLTEIKSAYIEQINPFLSKKILQVVRQLSDNSRSDKKLFKQIMKDFDIDLPYSKKGANASLKGILREEEFFKYIKKELARDAADILFPKSFLSQIQQNIKSTGQEQNYAKGCGKRKIIGLVKSYIPLKLKKRLAQQKLKLQMDPNLLAFRVVIIMKMHQKLTELVK